MKRIDNATATAENEFTEGNPGTGLAATILPAQWLNVVQAELAKIVEMAGITLDQTGVDDIQIAKALAVHVAGLDFYADSGSATAYVLSAIGAAAAENTAPPAYFDGMRVRFFPDNSNTGAATVNVASLGVKNIKVGTGAGSDPAAGAMLAGVQSELVFDNANDCFKLINGVAGASVSNDIGAMTYFAMNTAPDGWLECDAAAYSRTTYSDLFDAIGTTWGAGDGSTTFNVPPATTNNRFLRAAGGSLSVGQTQTDNVGSFSFSTTISGTFTAWDAGTTPAVGSSGNTMGAQTGSDGNSASLRSYSMSGGSGETRPDAMVGLLCIKYQ